MRNGYKTLIIIEHGKGVSTVIHVDHIYDEYTAFAESSSSRENFHLRWCTESCLQRCKCWTELDCDDKIRHQCPAYLKYWYHIINWDKRDVFNCSIHMIDSLMINYTTFNHSMGSYGLYEFIAWSCVGGPILRNFISTTLLINLSRKINNRI